MFSHISTLINVQKHVGLTVLYNEKWFSAIADDIPQLVWVCDQDGRKTFCSHRYLDYIGAPNLEAIDRAWTDFLHPDDRAATATAWNHSLTSGAPYTAEYRLQRSDGMYRYVRAQALPMRDGTGSINGWLGMSQDIHEERIAQQARDIRGRLVATDRLASSIARESINPLESMTNAMYLALQDHFLHDSTRVYLHMADEELRRLAHITAYSLRFYRQTGLPERKQLSHIVEHILSIYRSRLSSSQITVRTDYRDDSELLCYADDLFQALTSLLRNSMDAVQSQGQLCVRIRNAGSWSSINRPHVRITVADNGIGVPPEARESIFEPFAATRGITHAGLALWVLNQIIERHGGKTLCRSAASGSQQGTTFVVLLPIAGIEVDFGEAIDTSVIN